ncbi:target of rapamycin complex subunit lst8 [Anaeramoeba ignava]|uniref:Target of rapamycin complex subunit lst8 n=1 Tax=Anaeramoeba ignava TaxID=1746090 RepID=A0A9Q0LFQ6_ANAIG|nr:target of rapamycin complex subunit lst8 [Anaeramoeba ignava]
MFQVIFCTGGYDHTIRFWEVPSGINYHTIQFVDSQINKLEITPNRKYVVAAGNPTIKLYDIESNTTEAYASLEGHTNNVTGIGFQKDMKWMYSVSEDKTIKIWDLRARGCQRDIRNTHAINTAVLSPNQVELLTGDQNGGIRRWDLGQKQCIQELIPDSKIPVRSVTISNDASLVAAANNEGRCFVWALTNTKNNLSKNDSSDEKKTIQKSVENPTENVKNLKENSLAKKEISFDPQENSLNLENLAEFKPLHKINAHKTYILKCLISPDIKYLATTSADHTVKIWNIEQNFELDKTLTGHQRWVWDCAFSHDSCYLITGSSDHVARLWDIEQGETIHHYTGHNKAITAVALYDFFD